MNTHSQFRETFPQYAFSAIGLLAFVVALAAFAPAQGILQLHEPGANVGAGPQPAIEILPAPVPIPDGRRLPPHPVPWRPWPGPVPVLPADLTSLEVNVQIDGMTATTALDQTFRNPFQRRLEGTYLFPLPANAVIRDMSLYIDGKPVKCEVVEADKARAIYEEIVRRARDPALLEYVGRDLVKLRIFPVEPGQTRRVKFQYSQILKRDFGLTEYSYPLLTQQQAAQPIWSFTLTGSIHSDKPITAVNSPTHDIEFKRKDDKNFTFGFEKENFQPAANLKMYYGISDKEFGAGLVAYRIKSEDGYFMLMIAPRGKDEKAKRIPKDVTFVFDTSGSMAGDNIEQARRALQYCLNSLHEEDRFNIIRFSTESEPFAKGLVPASKDKIKEALGFVKSIEARGGTAINDALMEALSAKGSKERPHLIVFLTDGKPTVGEVNTNAILKNIAAKNENKPRIFVFGVGNSVNTLLLDKISDEHGGVTDYIGPKEDIEVKVSNFFTKVSDPILMNLALDFGSIKSSKAYPKALPDLFAGGQITLIGRYQGAGKADLVLSGLQGGDKKVFEYAVDFPEEATDADFLPRLWAIRRVGNLVDEIRKNGEEKELKDEVIALGKKYAIATPYTSMLVLEDGAMPPGAAQWGMRDGRRAEAGRGGGAAPGAPANTGPIPADWEPLPITIPRPLFIGTPKNIRGNFASPAEEKAAASAASEALKADSGATGVAIARATKQMKDTDRVTVSGTEGSPEVRQIAGRTFYLINACWTDSEYDGKAATINVVYDTDEYKALLKKGGDITKFLALGFNVIFKYDGKWYKITEPKQ
ncbi:MAG: VIT domain-containing protein [Candidatus Sumerlaeota bacterium]|nr:VIT domain-containing protein [Candidatus Sumerlaeota bacterium]